MIFSLSQSLTSAWEEICPENAHQPTPQKKGNLQQEIQRLSIPRFFATSSIGISRFSLRLSSSCDMNLSLLPKERESGDRQEFVKKLAWQEKLLKRCTPKRIGQQVSTPGAAFTNLQAPTLLPLLPYILRESFV
ncbi:MAG: hypothetical protein JSV88_20010 [Candidatus Aminicenantes bacterium]|nr:MAG: hypothetical protein JSV88_20010 [Candidatus Aminicenantes bacterium]